MLKLEKLPPRLRGVNTAQSRSVYLSSSAYLPNRQMSSSEIDAVGDQNRAYVDTHVAKIALCAMSPLPISGLGGYKGPTAN
jgi:hypothetical protein